MAVSFSIRAASAALIPSFSLSRRIGLSMALILATALPLTAQSTLYWDGNSSDTVGGGTGTWDTTGTNWRTTDNGSTYLSWDNAATTDDAVFQNTAGTVTLGTDITVHSLTFGTTGYNLAGSNTLTFDGGNGRINTGSGDQIIAVIIAGEDGLSKSGTGSLTLSATNSYSGNTYISDGTLTVTGSITTTGSIDVSQRAEENSTLSILAGGSVVNSGSMVIGSQFSATGLVDVAGTLTAESNLFAMGIRGTGSLTIQNGGVVNASSASEVQLAVLEASTGTLTIKGSTTPGIINTTSIKGGNGDATITFDHSGSDYHFTTDGTSGGATVPITGTAAVNQSGTGTTTLSNANDYTGGTTLHAGTLAVGGSSALGTGSVVLNGGALQSASGGGSLANAISLTADSSLSGSNALTLSGNVTLNGFKSLNVTNSAQTTLSGSIGQSGFSALIKEGSGELELTGANTYTGGTAIGAGTVRINNSTGSAFGTGAVTVASGATLAGAGSFTGALQLNGTYSPGNSPGTANTGSQTWGAGASYIWEINDANGSSGTHFDFLNITGSLTISATDIDPFIIEITSLTAGDVGGLTPNFDAASDYTYTIATASSGITGFSATEFTLNTDNFTNTTTGTWALGVVGNNLNLTYTGVSAVPEPSTYAALLGLAVLGFAAYRRRR